MTTRIAIFSDLHGNSAATEAVLAAIDAEAPDAVYNLGDLVGYGAKPNETIEPHPRARHPDHHGQLRRRRRASTATTAAAPIRTKTRKRGGSSRSSGREASPPRRTRPTCARSLPEIRFEAEGKRFRLVHGSPRRMNEYLFEDRDPRSLARIAQGAEADVLVFGHTHKPWVREIEDVLFVNDGSVGKPKDGDPRAAWALLTVERGKPVQVEIRRVPYDVATHGRGDPRCRRLARSLRTDIETGGHPERGYPLHPMILCDPITPGRLAVGRDALSGQRAVLRARPAALCAGARGCIAADPDARWTGTAARCGMRARQS